MKTRVDALTTLARPAKAANEDFQPVAPSEKPVFGWDAYEVWRTRIKPEQDRPDGSPQIG